VATVLGCGQLRRDVDKSEAQGCFQAELPSQLSTDRNATRRGRAGNERHDGRKLATRGPETGDSRAGNGRLAGWVTGVAEGRGHGAEEVAREPRPSQAVVQLLPSCTATPQRPPLVAQSSADGSHQCEVTASRLWWCRPWSTSSCLAAGTAWAPAP
jgi:hypothetical protein